MTREEFKNELHYLLKEDMDYNEINELINFYDEMILDRMDNGMDEIDAVNATESPQSIASEIAGGQTKSYQQLSSTGKALLIAVLILGFPLWGGLLLAAISIVLSFYLIIWCVPFTLGILGFSFSVSGIFTAVLSLFTLGDGLYMLLTQLGIGLFLFGAGLLSLLATFYLSKIILVLSISATQWLANLLKRGRVLSYEN